MVQIEELLDALLKWQLAKVSGVHEEEATIKLKEILQDYVDYRVELALIKERESKIGLDL